MSVSVIMMIVISMSIAIVLSVLWLVCVYRMYIHIYTHVCVYVEREVVDE